MASKMSFIIRKLEPFDIDFAKQLFWFFQIDDGIVSPVIPSDEYLKTLLSKDDFHVVVALQNNALIGGLTAYELVMYKAEIKEMFLYEIAVEPKQRRTGVAKALVEFLKRIGRSKGMKEMYVGTNKNNLAAMKLYQSSGGKIETGVEWFVYKLNH
jgi:aminoglycoside 3-N-acetyltransferase I